MRLALLSPLPPEQSAIADYGTHFRTSLNAAGINVLTPLIGQRPIATMSAARAWVAERDWRRIDVVHAELAVGRRSEFLTLCALAQLPNRPALSATIHHPDRLVWKPVHTATDLIQGAPWMPRPLRAALAPIVEPVTLWSERRLARRIDGLVAMTQTGAARLISHMRVPVGRVSVIPHPANHVAPRPLPSMESLRLLYFGFLQRDKGIEDLIEAVARVRSRDPDMASRLRLTLAGSSVPGRLPAHRDAYLAHLRAHVDRRGLTGLVRWELDVDERDVPDLVQRHHLMVLPHRDGRQPGFSGRISGTSRALVWAIACGRGALVSDAGTLAEEVRHGNGTMFRQGDVQRLATLIEGVLIQPELMAQWASRAVWLANDRAWSTTGQRFLGHFQRAIARAPRSFGIQRGQAASVWSQTEPL